MTEVGFHHPLRGYWQTTEQPSEEILASYPDGTFVVPLRPGSDYDLIDGIWVHVGRAAPSCEEYEAAIEVHLDQVARSRQFRDGLMLASYKESTNSQWAAEAKAFVGWRDQVWTFAFREMKRIEAGEREPPTVSKFLEELPVIDWT